MSCNVQQTVSRFKINENILNKMEKVNIILSAFNIVTTTLTTIKIIASHALINLMNRICMSDLNEQYRQNHNACIDTTYRFAHG